MSTKRLSRLSLAILTVFLLGGCVAYPYGPGYYGGGYYAPGYAYAPPVVVVGGGGYGYGHGWRH